MKYIFSISLFLATAGASYASSEQTDLSPDNSLNPPIACFDRILADYQDSIDHYSKDKVYLKPEMIYSDENSLWLYNDSIPLELPFLGYDASGYYVASQQINQILPWYKCTNPKCGRIWDLSTHYSTNCPICKSPGKLQGT